MARMRHRHCQGHCLLLDLARHPERREHCRLAADRARHLEHQEHYHLESRPGHLRCPVGRAEAGHWQRELAGQHWHQDLHDQLCMWT